MGWLCAGAVDHNLTLGLKRHVSVFEGCREGCLSLLYSLHFRLTLIFHFDNPLALIIFTRCSVFYLRLVQPLSQLYFHRDFPVFLAIVALVLKFEKEVFVIRDRPVLLRRELVVCCFGLGGTIDQVLRIKGDVRRRLLVSCPPDEGLLIVVFREFLYDTEAYLGSLGERPFLHVLVVGFTAIKHLFQVLDRLHLPRVEARVELLTPREHLLTVLHLGQDRFPYVRRGKVDTVGKGALHALPLDVAPVHDSLQPLSRLFRLIAPKADVLNPLGVDLHRVSLVRHKPIDGVYIGALVRACHGRFLHLIPPFPDLQLPIRALYGDHNLPTLVRLPLRRKRIILCPQEGHNPYPKQGK